MPKATPFTPVDGSGNVIGTSGSPTITQSQQNTYTLASNVASLAAGATTTPVAGVVGGAYIWGYQFAGTTPSLIIESLGPDGLNYITVATVTASGAQGLTFGNNATVRLRNAGANPITGLSSNLS